MASTHQEKPKKKNKESADVKESSAVKSLRKEKEREQLMRLKANQKLQLFQKLFSAKLSAMNVNVNDLTDSKFDEIQKKLQKTEAAQGNMQQDMEQLEEENIRLKKKLKEVQRTAPIAQKSITMIKDNIDEKSRKILTSNQTQQLFEGVLLNYSKKHKNYEHRWCKLTNDGELLIFKTESAKNVLKTLDLVSEYIDINKTRDNEFELIASSKDSIKLRTETEEDIAEWISNIKVVQYYFKLKSEQYIEDDTESVNENEEIDDNTEEKKEVMEEVETDPFWLDIKDKTGSIGYKRIKECIPARDGMDPNDKKNNKWKEILWKTEYGDFELSCNVQLMYYETGKLDEDENSILFASVSKYGINSKESWQKIADNLNREVTDAMKAYSKLVGIPVKKLKKITVARG